MADISHLERMGRELKCPIWYTSDSFFAGDLILYNLNVSFSFFFIVYSLSLLNSAVSLTCNHVFCK